MIVVSKSGVTMSHYIIHSIFIHFPEPCSVESLFFSHLNFRQFDTKNSSGSRLHSKNKVSGTSTTGVSLDSCCNGRSLPLPSRPRPDSPIYPIFIKILHKNIYLHRCMEYCSYGNSVQMRGISSRKIELA